MVDEAKTSAWQNKWRALRKIQRQIETLGLPERQMVPSISVAPPLQAWRDVPFRSLATYSQGRTFRQHATAADKRTEAYPRFKQYRT
ncbi:hypothetical protein [Amycolatopsis sp. NPDC054798]